MADYVPDTVVKVLKNVPLDDTYTDTRWFASTDEQQSFFNGKAKYTFTDMTYQRVNNSVANPRIPLSCRVPMIAENLYDCNYIMFQNTNYGSKWFYAFIRQVNYINPNNTEILYEIDYLQTFMFELRIKPSFVEREHASANEDAVFNNLTPEPIEVGEWVVDSYVHDYLPSFSHYKIRIAVVPNSLVMSIISTIAGWESRMYNGIYSGACYLMFDSADDANSFVDKLAAIDQSSSIIDISMTNSDAIADSIEMKSIGTLITPMAEATMFHPVDSTHETAYIARNKKLGMSQFSYYVASTGGNSVILKPEYIYGTQLSFFAYTSGAPYNQTLYVPNYMGRSGALPEDIGILREYSVSNDYTIQCTWNDKSYLGSAVSDGLKLAAGAISTVATGGTAALPEFLTGQIGNIASTLTAKEYSAHRGNTSTPAAMYFSTGHTGLDIIRMIPSEDDLKRIDQFFDMFGYQVNKVKVPNLNTRQSWNYVKLNTPCIYGSVPVEGMEIIKRAFSNGIRLWHVDAVGDYSVENPAL